MRIFIALLLTLLFPLRAHGLSAKIKDGNSTTKLEVNSLGAVEVVNGSGHRHIVNFGVVNFLMTASKNVVLLTPNSRGFRITKVCWSHAVEATAATTTTFILTRLPSVVSAGTVLVSETATAGTNVAKYDPADNTSDTTSYSNAGIGQGPILFQDSSQSGELSAGGTADFPGQPPHCKDFTFNGRAKGVIVPGGNGPAIAGVLGSHGAGALGAGYVTIEVVEEY